MFAAFRGVVSGVCTMGVQGSRAGNWMKKHILHDVHSIR
jgi:hypothetical protein